MLGCRNSSSATSHLKEKGPVVVPREFVFMDRAAVGLGAVFLHLKADLNFHQLFETEIERFSLPALADQQKAALDAAGLPLPR